MNIETLLSIQAYGTSEGVKKEWDERGRGNKPVPEADEYKPPKGGRGTRPGIARGDYKTAGRRIEYNMAWHAKRMQQYQDAGHERNEAGSLAMRDMNDAKSQDLSARGCHGPNCGRKGRKAGAVPLRSYTTKQETDNLNSKALKVKKNKRARRRY